VAAGVHPNPCEYADIVTSTTHKTLRGPRSGIVLCREKYAAAIDKAVFPGLQGGPLVHIIAAKAVCFLEAMQPEFVEYQKQVVANAKVLAAGLAEDGFRWCRAHGYPSAAGGCLLQGHPGREAERALDEAFITVNKNTIPFDVNPPLNPSGIRLGSPAVTTRGFGEDEMAEVATLIAEVLRDIASQKRAPRYAAASRSSPEVPAVRLEDEVRLPGREGSPAFSLPGR